jgi:hypothetical protein
VVVSPSIKRQNDLSFNNRQALPKSRKEKLNMKTKLIIASFTITLFITVLSGTFSTKNVNSQESDLVVEYLTSNEPIKIVSFENQNIIFNFGENFTAADDWLKTLEINIKNSFGKSVTYIDVGIFVVRPAGQEETPMFHYSIMKGKKSAALKMLDSGFELISNSTGTTANMSLLDKEYGEIRASLNNLGYPQRITHLKVQVEEVIFSDGTMWSIGAWYKIDLNNPDKLIRLDKKTVAKMKSKPFLPPWMAVLPQYIRNNIVESQRVELGM